MVQINSIYVNDGQTVVTMFVGNDNKVMYVVNDVTTSSRQVFELGIEPSPQLQEEIAAKAEKVWAGQQDLYYLRLFSLSKEMCQFVLHCWHEVRKREKKLFV